MLTFKETAQIVLKEMNLENLKIETNEALHEKSNGDCEGKPIKDVITEKVKKEIQENPYTFKHKNGESQKDVEERMLTFIQNYCLPLYKESQEKNRPISVALFCHQGTIKYCLRGLLGSNPKYSWLWKIENTSITEMDYDDEGWHFVCLNDHGHLLYL